jgi:SNF2 family DNA or RNA helicase
LRRLPVIAHEVLEAFKNRKLLNSEKLKQHPPEYLQRKIDELPAKPEWVYPPFKHQLVCFLLCVKFPRYFHMLDMGLGKTKVMLDAFNYQRQVGKATRMLVLVPQTTNLFAWQDQVLEHAPGLTVDTLGPQTKSADRHTLFFEGESDVLLTTYAGLSTILSEKVKGTKKTLSPNKKLIRLAAKRFDTVVMDECSFVGNWQSLIFRILRIMTPTTPFVYGLSGTPFNGDPQKLWSQFYLIDRGASLGTSLGILREVMFKEKSNGFATVWKLPKKNEKKLYRLCRHRGIRYEESEAADLPPLVGGIAKPQICYVNQSTPQAKHSLRLHDELSDAHGAGESLVNSYSQMRSVAAGFLSTESGPSFFKPNAKIDALLSLVEELGDRQAIVFHHHRVIGEQIRDALKKAKKTTAAIYGGQAGKDKQMERFKSGAAQILVANSNAAAFGLNLQFCNVSIFFESPDDITTRKQAEKRTHRTGVAGTVFIYDIVARGTVDEKILEALKENKRVLDKVLDG